MSFQLEYSIRSCLLSFLCCLILSGQGVGGAGNAMAQSGILGGPGRLIMPAGGQPLPSYSTIHPSHFTTQQVIRWPLCFGRQSVLLGSYCVPPSTDEQEKDPKKLPQISIDLKAVAPHSISVFLFDDEENAYQNFWADSIANKSCDALQKYARAVVQPGTGTPQWTSGSRSLKGKEAHLWYVVAVNCATRLCPNISDVNVTFYHPTSDGTRDSCTTGSLSLSVLKGAMVEGWQALRLRNVLQVSSVTPLGVVVLYFVFLLMAGFSMVLVLQINREQDLRRKELLHGAFFIVTVGALSYLVMATGNGLWVMRKVGDTSAWTYSNPVMATHGDHKHPNPFYDEKYAKSPTYPFFFARYINWMVVTAMEMYYMTNLVGASSSSMQMLVFCAVCRVLCGLASSAITTASRWLFWLMGIMFAMVGLFEIASLKQAAMRKGKHVTRVYKSMARITFAAWAVYPFLWILGLGAKIVASDLDIIGMAVVDVLLVVGFGLSLAGATNVLSSNASHETRGLADNSSGPSFSGAGLMGDDLGDLEDNL